MFNCGKNNDGNVASEKLKIRVTSVASELVSDIKNYCTIKICINLGKEVISSLV